MANRFTVVMAAEAALTELGATSKEAKDRCAVVLRGMVALDEEQMATKETIANLIDSLEVGYSVPEVIEDLKGLVKKWDRESRAALRKREAKKEKVG
jgi:hypothetical protein